MLSTVHAKAGCHTVRYGLGADNDYRAEDLSYPDGFPSFTMVHGEVRVPVKLTVMGEHNVMNALAALAVADAYGVPLADAAEKLLEFGGFKNRQQIYHKNDYTIVDDTYNASPDSMKAAIGVLSSLPAGRRIAVLADMKELGENTIQFHREVGAFLAEKPVDILVVYGELAQAIAEGAKKVKPDLHIVSFEEDEKEDMLDWLDAQIGEGDAVLFKGSNSMKLGETAARFISVEKTPTSSGGE